MTKTSKKKKPKLATGKSGKKMIASKPKAAAAAKTRDGKSAEGLKMSLNHYTSRAYHGARTAARKRGLSDTQAKKLAGEAYRKASAEWRRKFEAA